MQKVDPYVLHAPRQPERSAGRVSGAAEGAGRAFLNAIGGPMGRYATAGRQRFFTPLRVMLFIGFWWLGVAYLAKVHCIRLTRTDTGWSGLNWGDHRQYVAGCYNDIIALYGVEGLRAGHFPYQYSWTENGGTRYMEYPVLAGLYQWFCAQFSRALAAPLNWLVGEEVLYFSFVALGTAIAWALIIKWTVELTGNRIWDSWLWLLSPVVAVHAFTNFDIISVAFALAALVAAKRNHMLVSGIAIGLGTAFKLWPLFLLGAFLVLAFRSRQWKPFIVQVAATIASWAAANAPIYLLYPEGWGEFFRMNQARSWEWTTIYAVLNRELGVPWTPELLNTVSLVGFLGCCLGIAVYGAKVAVPPRVGQLCFLIVAAFLVFNKVYSPQYSIWLVPFVVLALPRWPLVIAWMLNDALVWYILMWHMNPDHKAPGGLLDLVVITRLILLGIIVFNVLREMKDPARDKVRAAHDGRDPLAGPFGIVPLLGPGAGSSAASDEAVADAGTVAASVGAAPTGGAADEDGHTP